MQGHSESRRDKVQKVVAKFEYEGWGPKFGTTKM